MGVSSSPPGPDRGEQDDDPGGDDPFAGLTLDEAFVRAAPVNELPAAERERLAAERARREAELRRRLTEGERRGGATEPPTEGLHRLAPGGWDADDMRGGFPEEVEPGQLYSGDDIWDDDWASDEDLAAHRRRRSRVLQVVALVVVVAIVVVYVASHLVGIVSDDLRSGETRAATGTGTGAGEGAADPATGADDGAPGDPTVELVRPTDWPAVQADPSPTPLGTPGPVPEGGGPHGFLKLQPDGTPVAYDPCRPIHYVTRPGGPPEGDVLIREAIAAVSLATGLRFVDDGTTDEAPSDDRRPYQPEVYSDRWAPVLFAWSDSAETPRLGEVDPDQPQADPAAFAGSLAVGLGSPEDAPGTTPMVYVSGSVTLDGPDLTRLAEGPDGRAIVRSIIQHEIAHLVGLDHVEDRGQLMYPVTQSGVTGFAAGDLEGLAALGRGDCFPQI